MRSEKASIILPKNAEISVFFIVFTVVWKKNINKITIIPK